MKGVAGTRPAVLAAVLSLIVACGCAGKAVVAPSTPPSTAPTSEAPYDVASEGRFPPAPAVVAAPTGAPRSDTAVLRALPDPPTDEDRTPRTLQVEDVAATRATPAQHAAQDSTARTHPGFRVQIFAGRSRAVAERIRGEVMAAADVRAYIEFVDPYYKVQVGDCPTRITCRTLEDELRQRGYESPWTVPARIHP